MFQLSHSNAPSPSPSSPLRLCRNPSLSLRATGGSVAISLFSIRYEIVSVVSLPRNDIVTQSPLGRGIGVRGASCINIKNLLKLGMEKFLRTNDMKCVPWRHRVG